MANDPISDHLDDWYPEKLWRLIPAIYRTKDTPSTPGGVGPLRELVNRIGTQMAVVRRSIDRLWENESIETCDDWVIPYIGDLLATRIIAFLDSRAQRLDVANTIFYRRREGTVALLEQLAADIAGRDARVVEFFRRLGRTRHQFDPEIGVVSKPANATVNPLTSMVEGLVGTYSLTQAGGFADLRNAYAAANSRNAFDEFAHSADLRRGGQSDGWYNISHLGVFIWWLQSFEIQLATPCQSIACPGHYTFDPTGREIPLYALAARTSQSFGENWVAPNEWQLPVAIREVLWDTVPDQLYPDSLAVFAGTVEPFPQVPRTDLVIFPETGRFDFVGPPPLGSVEASYHFGFLAPIGAGGFDERILPSTIALPEPIVGVSGGGSGLDAAIAAISGSATIEIRDSRTYPGLTSTLDVATSETVVLRAENQRRPVVRWPGPTTSTFVIHGEAPGTTAATTVVVQGILFQGADIVLSGEFDTVILRLVTLDPGTAADPGSAELFDVAIDGTPLRPVHLYIEAKVGHLVMERSIVGPVRTRNGGSVELLTATDCIIQSIPTHVVSETPASSPLFDAADLAAHWKTGSTPEALGIGPALPAGTVAALDAYTLGTPPSAALIAELQTALLAQNRALMESAYPIALADLALGLSSGTVSLARCSVLGPSATHRIEASETVFDEVAVVQDPQHGCVRFSAYAENSNLHQPFRSVVILSQGPVFVSRRFGDPEYARLRRDADQAIVAPKVGDTIVGGAENGSEMGAFATERITLKKRGLALKFLEFMPLGVSPVWIDAD